VRFFTSLHLQTPDLEAVRATTESLLEPGLDAYIVESWGWVSVYAARLEEQIVQDVNVFAQTLSRLGRCVVFMVHDDINLAVLTYRNGLRIAAHTDDPDTFDLPSDGPEALANALEIKPEGVRLALDGGNASARVAGLAGMLGIQPELACAGFDDLAELDEDDELPEEFSLIEGPDPDKPGLGEYFGRSVDE
jgi:hypothetical protein